MCLIIQNKSNELLFDIIPQKKVLVQLENNPDGFGITYLDTHKKHIKMVKGFSIKEFLECLKLIESVSDCYHIHFRKATVGKVSLENTHPFDILGNGSLYLMHNGTLPLFLEMQNLESEVSDTFFLSNYIYLTIKKNGFNYIFSKDFKLEIETLLGLGRAILIHDRGSIILNENLWFSFSNKLLLSKSIDELKI